MLIEVWGFLFALKSNRLTSVEKGTWMQIQELNLETSVDRSLAQMRHAWQPSETTPFSSESWMTAFGLSA
jgi:hypothetical protein